MKKGILPFTLFTFDRLGITPPPADVFEDLIGYSGDLRFVGFCYQGQTLCIEDGQINEIGDWRPWSIWYRTLGVEILKRFCFGYRGRDPEHMLILDRRSRAIYAGPVRAAQDALRQQVPRPAQTASETLSPIDQEKKEEDLTSMLTSTMSAAECETYQAKQKEGMAKLEQWLT